MSEDIREKRTVLRGVRIFQGDRGFVPGTLEILGDRFGNVTADESFGDEARADAFGEKAAGGTDQNRAAEESRAEAECIDMGGAFLLPGLVDIHTHGNSGYDFSDGDPEGLRHMGRYQAAHGITSFLPTSMTLPYETLDAAFQTAAEYLKSEEQGAARIMGIHMEGPFFSEKKKGAQNALYLRLPDAEAVRKLNDRCGGLLRIVDVAPELPGAEEFTKSVAGSGLSRVSVAHTDASYEETKAVFRAGADHVTHLYNAMPDIHHRYPGVIGAAAEEENVTAELICDGFHVHPSVVRMTFRLFPGRVCLISDSLRCCGMPDGIYELGGQQVTLKDHAARLSDGTIAGAVSNLFDDLKNAVRFGIPLNDAVKAATIIPAAAIGCDHLIGSVEKGKYADFVVCDRELNILQVYVGGKQV